MSSPVSLSVLVPIYNERATIERLLNVSFLPGSIYVITKMPSDPQQADIIPIALVSLALSFLATLYPAWKAASTDPVQVLRYE